MRFYLFLLLNAVLFVRPAEIVPDLEGAPIYEAVIIVCLAVSAPAVLRQLRGRSLVAHPITACVLGLVAAVVLSQLARGYFNEAYTHGVVVLKIVAYYLLLVGVVDTPARLRQFLGWVAVLILVVAALALLEYHGAIDLPSLAAVEQREFDPLTGESQTFPRLCGMGIFNDPNDLSVVLVVGMTISLARVGERGPLRLLWLVPLGVMGYALTLTRSRGGFLALLAALLALLVARLGARKALLVAAVVLPALIVVFGGRQTSIDLSDQNDTSQHRIRLWRDGLVLLRTAPVFGVGAGRYEEEVGLVAHNSFVHAYTELGILGGTLFAAAFVHPITLLYRLGARKGRGGHPALQGLAPTVLACVAGMVGGMMSLSRVYTLTPYLILGLVAVYLRLATESEPSLAPRLTPRLVGRFLVISVLLLCATDVFVRIFAGTG